MTLPAEVAKVRTALEQSDLPTSSLSSAQIARAVAQTIDHTLLKTDATADQIDKLCNEALVYRFKTVCVRLPFVSRAKALLGNSDVGVCCVISFHEGTDSLEEKLSEAKSATAAGARELDTVLNRAHVAPGTNYLMLAAELGALREATAAHVKLKLILETARLTSDQIIAATVVAYHAGFDFVKTSTGFDGQGATVEHVSLMRRAADELEKIHGKHMEVKASGGIRSFDDAKKMLCAGASRLGASAGVAIVEQAKGAKVESIIPAAGGY